jgi:hydroxyacylglutathione hydrolase
VLFEKVESKGLAQYSYIIGDGYEAIVIDPRRDCQVYIDHALRAGMQITHILETHRHEDFAVGSVILSDLTGAQIWHADPQLPYEYGKPVVNGQTWNLGSMKLKALHTPGHTEGSRSYVLYAVPGVPWYVFTGDVLFPGEVGRVDFLGMDRAPEMAAHLYDSIFNVLLPLGDGVIMCPGHGYGSACGSSIADRPMSTLGIERQLNPRLQHQDRDAFVTNVSRQLPKPDYFSKMEKLNIAGTPPAKGIADVRAFPPKQFRKVMKGAVVIDLRSISSYAGLHVPGALSIVTDDIPSYIGWFVDTESPILLVGESGEVRTTVTYLNRQGYDNVLGYLSGGMHDWTVADLPIETTRILTPEELFALLKQENQFTLIDVRSPEEYVTGALPCAQNIPIKGFISHIDDVPGNSPVVMYCEEGPRSAATVSALQRAGHKDVTILRGGIFACRQSGLFSE